VRACTKQSDCGFLEICANGCCGDFPKFVCQPVCDV